MKKIFLTTLAVMLCWATGNAKVMVQNLKTIHPTVWRL